MELPWKKSSLGAIQTKKPKSDNLAVQYSFKNIFDDLTFKWTTGLGLPSACNKEHRMS